MSHLFFRNVYWSSVRTVSDGKDGSGLAGSTAERACIMLRMQVEVICKGRTCVSHDVRARRWWKTIVRSKKWVGRTKIIPVSFTTWIWTSPIKILGSLDTVDVLHEKVVVIFRAFITLDMNILIAHQWSGVLSNRTKSPYVARGHHWLQSPAITGNSIKSGER